MSLRTICLGSMFSFFKSSKARCLVNSNFIYWWINLTNINFENIGEQIKFIDTIKYYQQSLSTLVATMMETEKQNIKAQHWKFINKNQKLNQKFLSCTQKDQEWVLNYLSSGKGIIPYEMITRFDWLDIKPVKRFFAVEQLYSQLKGGLISEEEYQAVKKLYQT